jgi:hypothetical protein
MVSQDVQCHQTHNIFVTGRGAAEGTQRKPETQDYRADDERAKSESA